MQGWKEGEGEGRGLGYGRGREGEREGGVEVRRGTDVYTDLYNHDMYMYM